MIPMRFEIWRLYEAHSTSSATLSNIFTDLGQELAKLKIVAFDNPTKGLDTFYSYLPYSNPKNSQNDEITLLKYLFTPQVLNFISSG